MSSPADAHLDLDALADVLAREASHQGSGPASEHLAGCADCRAALDDVRSGSAVVAADLAALPAVPIPADLAVLLHEALRGAPRDTASSDLATTDAAVSTSDTATVTTLPAAAGRSPLRWLPAAAAALVLLAGVGFGISQLGGGSGRSDNAESASGSKAAAAPTLNLIRNSSGTDYTDRASLSAALPGLLAGTSVAHDSASAQTGAAPNAPLRGVQPNTMNAADPLAHLKDNAGLADCLVALLDPAKPSMQPLALDYASYQGKPAMIVVLPGSEPNKLDVFVVGPGCSQANDSLLFYTSVDRP